MTTLPENLSGPAPGGRGHLEHHRILHASPIGDWTDLHLEVGAAL